MVWVVQGFCPNPRVLETYRVQSQALHGPEFEAALLYEPLLPHLSNKDTSGCYSGEIRDLWKWQGWPWAWHQKISHSWGFGTRLLEGVGWAEADRGLPEKRTGSPLPLTWSGTLLPTGGLCVDGPEIRTGV